MKILYACVFLVACKSSDGKEQSAKPVEGQTAQAVPCAPAAAELAKQLETANGFGLMLDDPKTQPAIDAAKAAIVGKRYSFKDCKFSSQGNDVVSFAADATAQDIGCVMAGGEAGNKKFRQAAMGFEMSKLKLDVTGTVKLHEDRLHLADCEITPHE